MCRPLEHAAALVLVAFRLSFYLHEVSEFKVRHGIFAPLRHAPASLDEFCSLVRNSPSSRKPGIRTPDGSYIYEEAFKHFPDDGSLFQAASLFWRRQRNYARAVEICKTAIAKGLRDGTKSGFEGRVRRLEKEARTTENSSPAPPPLA